MSFIKQLKMMAFGSRMKNFTDLMMKDVAKIYKDLDVDFEPRWFTFFSLLCEKNEEIPITKIAEELNQSHPAVIQVASMLEKKGLVKTRTDSIDQRKRLVSLSKKGKELANKMSPIWKEIKGATEDFIFDVEPAFLKIIEKLENSYKKKSLYKRIKERLSNKVMESAELIDYNSKYQKTFSLLNMLWLEATVGVSDHDLKVLTHPEKEIIKKKGIIKLLKLNDEIIGTFVLLPVNDKDCELCKFTVKNNYRGMGLGEFLLKDAIKCAKENGFESTFLFSHDKLKEATSLYKKVGFKFEKDHPHMKDHTGRCSFLMSIRN